MSHPQAVFDELIGSITHAIRTRPRELQTRIGPSELGEPCSRALIAKLMAVPGPAEPPNWKATVGTSIHEHLQRIFEKLHDGERYLCETTVSVGHIGGVEITGDVDLYDRRTYTVVDWKSKSRNQMNHHRRTGAGSKYISQAQLYGLGMTALGYRVTQVMDVFLPRDGELADAFYWAAPFDPDVGLNALARANRLHVLATTFGVAAVQSLFSECTDEWCRTCTDVNKIRPGRTRVSSADNPFALANEFLGGN